MSRKDEHPEWRASGRDLTVPFVFVPEGDPEPVEWLRAHPGAVRFPATLAPRQGNSDDDTRHRPSLYSAAAEPAAPPSVGPRKRPSYPPTSDPNVADTSDYWQRLDEAQALVNAGREATPADTELVAEHLAKTLTLSELERVRHDGIGFRVTEVNVGHQDPELNKMQARGYLPGASIGGTPGTYLEQSQEVVIATEANSNHERRLPDLHESTSADVLLHELGHGLNRQEGSRGSYLSDSPEFILAYQADTYHGSLAADYFHQKATGEPRDGARDEAFAESFALYNSDPDRFHKDYPKLYEFFSKHLER